MEYVTPCSRINTGTRISLEREGEKVCVGFQTSYSTDSLQGVCDYLLVLCK